MKNAMRWFSWRIALKTYVEMSHSTIKGWAKSGMASTCAAVMALLRASKTALSMLD